MAVPGGPSRASCRRAGASPARAPQRHACRCAGPASDRLARAVVQRVPSGDRCTREADLQQATDPGLVTSLKSRQAGDSSGRSTRRQVLCSECARMRQHVVIGGVAHRNSKFWLIRRNASNGHHAPLPWTPPSALSIRGLWVRVPRGSLSSQVRSLSGCLASADATPLAPRHPIGRQETCLLTSDVLILRRLMRFPRAEPQPRAGSTACPMALPERYSET